MHWLSSSGALLIVGGNVVGLFEGLFVGLFEGLFVGDGVGALVSV
jgi:hypothetical protein